MPSTTLREIPPKSKPRGARYSAVHGMALCRRSLYYCSVLRAETRRRLSRSYEVWTWGGLGACQRKKSLKNNALELRGGDLKISHFPETRVLTGDQNFPIFSKIT